MERLPQEDLPEEPAERGSTEGERMERLPSENLPEEPAEGGSTEGEGMEGMRQDDRGSTEGEGMERMRQDDRAEEEIKCQEKMCSPCKFHCSGKKCENSEQCKHCHFCPPGEFMRRKKEEKETRRKNAAAERKMKAQKLSYLVCQMAPRCSSEEVSQIVGYLLDLAPQEVETFLIEEETLQNRVHQKMKTMGIRHRQSGRRIPKLVSL